MRKNPHGKILKREFKEQHLNTISKFFFYIYIYIYRGLSKLLIKI